MLSLPVFTDPLEMQLILHQSMTDHPIESFELEISFKNFY